MTIFIEGPAIPLDIKNMNGWGVKTQDAAEAISSLKSSVVRVCSRYSPHGCDASADPNREIGYIVDAWEQNGQVITKAAITDSIAVRKMKEGTWGNKWSVFAPTHESLDDGWVKGIKIRALTLVKDPAWENASWNLAASLEKEKTGLTRAEVQTLVASAIEMHIEEQNRNESFAKLEAAKKDLGLETNKEDYKGFSASGLNQQTEEFSRIKLGVSDPKPVSHTACTGAYDTETGEWR
jgi:hypothetical protein